VQPRSELDVVQQALCFPVNQSVEDGGGLGHAQQFHFAVLP
jgi:hypothetical protein